MGKASRRKQDQFLGRDGSGNLLFPETTSAQPSLSGIPISWLLTVIAVSLWATTHLVSELSGVTAAGYVIVSIAVGVLNPLIGVALAIIFVPFSGGTAPQGLAELVRSAPIHGAAARLLWVRFIQPDGEGNRLYPSLILVGAAALAIILYPITRITANGADWAPASRLLDDILFMVGAPAAAYASWITFSHLPRNEVDRVLRTLPVSLAVALIVAFAAWIGIGLTGPFAFDGIVYGRLGALGYPTPTAMGVAIALPLATAAIWNRSRNGAILLATAGVAVIVLTQSRGPLLALILGTTAVSILRRQIPRRYVIAGVSVALSALIILLLVRYPDLIRKLSHGRLPSLRGDELRIISWVAAFQIALANPITGGGWMSVRGWNNGELGSRNVNLSHNMILQGLADGGIPLGAAIAAVVIGSLRSAWKQRNRVPASWLCAAAVVIVCGLWDMPQLRAYAAVMSGAALGLVSRRAHEEDGPTA